MIKFIAETKAGHLLGLGITAENVKRLKSGQPLHVFCSQVGLPWPGEILIFFGETESDIHEQLSEFIGPQTICRDEKGDT